MAIAQRTLRLFDQLNGAPLPAALSENQLFTRRQRDGGLLPPPSIRVNRAPSYPARPCRLCSTPFPRERPAAARCRSDVEPVSSGARGGANCDTGSATRCVKFRACFVVLNLAAACAFWDGCWACSAWSRAEATTRHRATLRNVRRQRQRRAGRGAKVLDEPGLDSLERVTADGNGVELVFLGVQPDPRRSGRG
jgi:hypothetical protein